ncbi:Sterol 3-beta-glucosyltransferase UGT80B1 [Escovopsis weberi]|uniref:Sterol 3-beta-glucosyltransferase UGT80B1 n=1 Tax=Escovopsis weberi TaxID=150374 RepID=A0A0M8N182_ESCWE|nr:Sterol 3-beta-glucosyltransferase UGT80B1 [Escovopsis weberi]
MIPDIHVPIDAPPAYGSAMDHFELLQPGLDAGVAVTGDGRVNININQKNRRLAELLAPVVAAQSSPHPGLGLPPSYRPPSAAAAAAAGRPRPAPRLNIVVQIVGSRGDVQPFVALGKVLKESHGHRVRIATHPTFQAFVEDNGLEFFSIGGDPAELMAFMVKHPGLMPGLDALRSGEIKKRRDGVQEMLLGCWRSCIEAGDGLGPPPQTQGRYETWDPAAALPGGDAAQVPFVADAIIANPPSFAHIHIAEKLGIPLHMMFTMPWSPTRAFPHPLANIQSTNADDAITNYLTYRLVEMMTWQGLGDVINRFREKALDLAPLEMIWAPGLLQRLKISYTYCWSPALIPKPNDWAAHIDVAGFYFLNLASSYAPDPELAAFLEAGPPPVYIGFGSIVVDDPNAMTRLIFDAIHLAGVRALVSKGWGGLGADAVGLPEGVFMLGNVPHDWLFERVACVVHHGGAGTTAAGIKAGKPTVVVPFFGDQPFWGAMISRAKAGPDPIPHAALTAEKLAEAIEFCLRPETQEQAQGLGAKIREEKGAETGALSFHGHLDLDSLKCSVAPNRVAAWRVRRTNVKLSPLAAAVLVDKNLLDYRDLKLQYITEGQPPEPITAGASAIMADLSSIGMSLFADLPVDMFKSLRQSVPPSTTIDAQNKATDGGASNSGRGTSTSPGPDTTSPSASTRISSPPPPASTAELNGPGSAAAPGNSSLPPELLALPVSSKTAATIDATVSASRGVGRAVVTGVKSPMNFCLGLAKGFRNLPRLYNDDTVRDVEKVTDLSSGLKIAGKEFGLGFYDGVAGLVTQPMRGAQRDGVGGLVKGFGKGIGGLIVKPAAGIWGLPAYVMQGAYAEVNKYLARSAHNYIKTSRVIQGRLDADQASADEKLRIVNRWNNELGPALNSYYARKRKEAIAEKAPIPISVDETSQDVGLVPSSHHPQEYPSSTGGAPRQVIRRRAVPSRQGDGLPPVPLAPTDQQYEEAIRASVRETSQGNAEEDAAIETAIRQSVNAARKAGDLPVLVHAGSESNPAPATATPTIFEDVEYQITDGEYQDLIARATLESLTSQAVPITGSPHQEGVPTENQDADIERAMQQPHDGLPPLPHRSAEEYYDWVKEEEDLRRAIAASKADMEQAMAARIEDEIVLEYIMKQSLAEAQLRKQRVAKRQEGPAEEKCVVDDDGDDADLRRALEDSLRVRGSHTSDQGLLSGKSEEC